MAKIENVFYWCLKQGEKSDKHKGLRKIIPNFKESKAHLKKAESNLGTMQYLYDGGKTDWVASAAFYAMYHILIALLYKLGYESRNQECTINAIEFFMKEGKISLEQEFIDMIRLAQEQETTRDIKTLREEYQYGTETAMEDKLCLKIMDNARQFVDRIKEVLETLK
ncbi:HEPN domain-containing protein [Candidatus Woesearchaeota archaeon]|nr:HEPN domain-containing protein [Candidatus Woesearchaeota archaeon]HLC80672.1 HEPN domain-containing protein [Candidatus Nanoarchaeia archaeon]